MANRPLDGYPTSWGSSKASIFPHSGPTSYTQVTLTAGSAPTGGDTLQASEAGMKYFDNVQDGSTDDGIFQCIAIPKTPSGSIPGAPGATYTLMWIANKTGAFGGQAQTFGTEAVAATNLSTFTVRLLAVGPK